MSNPSTIAAFDFDGTITHKDSFFRFLVFSQSTFRIVMGSIILSPVLLIYKLKWLSNYRAKQIVFSWFFKGWSLDDFNEKSRLFAIEIDKIIRPKAMDAIRVHQEAHHTLVIISASIENWVSYWAQQKGIHHLLATQIEIDPQQRITGRLLSKNCYGQEKVNRLVAAFPNRQQYTLIAYGDSAGDKELLAFADEGYLNKFI